MPLLRDIPNGTLVRLLPGSALLVEKVPDGCFVSLTRHWLPSGTVAFALPIFADGVTFWCVPGDREYDPAATAYVPGLN